jgi:DNA replication protein
VHLLSKKLIEYRTEQGLTYTTLDPLKQLLLQNFQQHIIRQTQAMHVSDTGNIYQWIEKQFSRTLSPIEVSSIRDWLNFGYHETTIQEAVKQAISKHQFSIRIIDKILQKQTTKTNINQEGIPGNKTDVRKQIDLINQQMQDEDNRKK